MHYDIIGDVHGCATKLRTLLERLGYGQDADGVYRHPSRIAIFVGDLVDRGDEQHEALQLVKAMVDAGSAKAVMGNHEFNAIAWATRVWGKPLRKHSSHNRAQHKAFLKLPRRQRRYWVKWFKTLPLWLDLDGIRVVHACWHAGSIEAVEKATGSNRLLKRQHIKEANREKSDLYNAVEVLLKGPEIDLIDHQMKPYWDFESDKERRKARIRWWKHDARQLPQLADLDYAKMKGEGNKKIPYPTYEPRDVKPEYLTYVYKDQVPLFYGHYGSDWANHRDEWTTYTACVDFSACYGGTLVAYRWNGEPEIHWSNYVPHDPQVVDPAPSDETV